MAHRGGRRNRRGDNKGQKWRHDDEKSCLRDIDKVEETPITEAFRQYQSELDNRHDKYERLVKISRDVTIDSKRTIFLLHRCTGSDSKPDTMKEAENKLKEIQATKFRLIAAELQKEDVHQFSRAISPGIQEYVEAVSFFHYLRDGSLVSLEQVKKDLVFDLNTNDGGESTGDTSAEVLLTESTSKEEMVSSAEVHISPMDYVLGIADLTGELMRMAINSVGAGDLDLPFSLCNFIRVIHDAFLSFGNVARELPRKLAVLKQSLQKVEAACYTLQVRGSEIPKHMLVDVIRSVKNVSTDFYDSTDIYTED